MKTIIYWFSGTGNSLAVAKELAKSCGDAELVSIARVFRKPPPSAERIGLVFPVYAFCPPALVSRFVEKVANDCAQRPGQDKRRPEQGGAVDAFYQIQSGDNGQHSAEQ